MTRTYELTAKCDGCGRRLYIQEDMRRGWYIEVCVDCIEEARSDGYEEGEGKGYEEGYSDGERDAEKRFRDYKSNG